jgi:hypothetical protein
MTRREFIKSANEAYPASYRTAEAIEILEMVRPRLQGDDEVREALYKGVSTAIDLLRGPKHWYNEERRRIRGFANPV